MSNTVQQINLGGTLVWVEVSDIGRASTGTDPFERTNAGASEIAEQASQQLAKADIGPTLQAVFEPVHRALAGTGPLEVTVELSIGIKGGIGFFIASGEANASLKVSAKWKLIDTKQA